MNPSTARSWRTGALVLVGLLLVSFLALEPADKANERLAAAGEPGTVGGPAGEDGVIGGPAIGGPGTPGQPGANTPGAPGSKSTTGGTVKSNANGLQCKAGANGGATAKGVTGDRIKLAATNVRSGVGSSFLGTAYIGMQAVVNRVNSKGGICGRLLDLRLVDDGWEQARGATFIENFTQGDYFALPVVPSSEGLTQAIKNRTISGAAIPVIGTDGMLKEQYSDPWVWPVATATVSTMRIMAKHAHDKGAKTFGIVWDQQYKFGQEGASAFKQYVKQLTGSDVKADVGITPGRANYSGEANRFNEQCNPGCDFVAFLLDPTTANTYISSQVDKDGRRQGFGKVLTGGAQPLFNERFARDCGRPCDGMLVWTGYNPPIGGLASKPGVAAYINDVKSVDPGVDVNNQFLEGAYLGMQVFVEALTRVGPKLTREALQQQMNNMKYASDLSSPLAWSANQRFANQAAQAFRVVTASGTFAGFAEVGSGFIPDPTPGVVPK